MADVAEPRGPAGTGASGPVVAGTRFPTVADRTGASGPKRSETGEPVVTGVRFQTGNDIAEASGPAATGAGGSVGVGMGFRTVSGRTISESGTHYTDPDAFRGTLDTEHIGFPSLNRSPNEGNKPVDADGTEDTADGDAIMVGVVGSAAPWFLTGWTNDVEVEFMIDTGCQVTILATAFFFKCAKFILK